MISYTKYFPPIVKSTWQISLNIIKAKRGTQQAFNLW